jgi:hypothetical protein
MAQDKKTLSAPIALIEINGKFVGKMRSIRVQEQIQRGDVRGIGELVSLEKPILAVNCTFSASSAMVSLKKLGTIDNPFVKRDVQTSQQFKDTILLRDFGVNIHIYRKVPVAGSIIDGVVTETDKDRVAIIENAFLDSQSFSIDEGNVAMSDISGTYLNPIIDPL